MGGGVLAYIVGIRHDGNGIYMCDIFTVQNFEVFQHIPTLDDPLLIFFYHLLYPIILVLSVPTLRKISI